MDEWKKILHKQVYATEIAVHIKDNKIMVRVKDNVNLFTLRTNEEALVKADQLVAAFSTLTEEL